MSKPGSFQNFLAQQTVTMDLDLELDTDDHALRLAASGGPMDL